DPEEQVQAFLQSDPSLTEFSSQISFYSKLEEQISELPLSCSVGSVLFDTDELKLALTQECRLWKRAFGAALNRRASADMDDILSFMDGLTKRLQRPITDLEDVRGAMAALREVREAEVRIDATIGPVEESFALLNKHELLFNDGNAERVDGLTYGWKNLNALVVQNQNTLVKIQPSMKADLLSAVQSFQSEVQSFCTEYNHRGPGVEGVAPAEASERLQSFQAEFDQLWRKYTTYSGGEELFGLPVKEYPDLQRIKRELSLLSKLYSLYNSVIDSVTGYYDILWADLNIEKINTELQDFQNRIRKLPKALKEWQAFSDLKKTIDDFTETCPLLYMMANKAMLPRHWTRLSELTAHSFQVESESFSLRNIMEAPLLKNKEDIEDVCISAVKERDIEAKLKDVVAEWSGQMLSFATFRTRGELLLKGAETAEKISMMEDSLMVLTSLLSNRYNAPFKPSIQLWVQKLSNTSEIIEKWLSVQNLWIYLEAVFVGGDIAKQLPQEAKRFQNIDKSWQRIMQKAHEVPNVVQCCVGDEMLSQVLSWSSVRSLCPVTWRRNGWCFLVFSLCPTPPCWRFWVRPLTRTLYRVVFNEKVYDQIISFQSQEGETVDLSQPVLAQGNVEMWLGQLLAGVRQTLHAIIRQAYLAISDPGMKLLEFESAFPAQVGLLGIQMIWTRDAEEALVLSLAQSGAWGCFDEFNRIELPVLSVAAQQIYIVLQCKKNKKKQFVFTDGDVVDMDPEFGIFLTMNPGYAGRQELPENLKIQFRTVAMMVPDRAIIMRVKLASAGFRDNQVLSRKFYTLYKLCEEQLSKQVDEDEPLFMSLINDLFPGIVLDKAGYPDLESSIFSQAQQAGLIPHPPWILKLVQLYETQRVRHGMMTLGPSGAGKTACIHTLMKAMTECGSPHREMRMNPKAITASQMFGTLDVTTNDWTDGVFSTLWRKTLKAKK
ncbi:dynein heavy chain 5, axonemal-like protein, partial [Lates japonicus]